MTRKLLFALAALLATAAMVALAWGVTALVAAGVFTQPKWLMLGVVALIFAASGVARWRKRRAGQP
jgi:membrane protein implicated in regulation of membrane protease activity